MMVPAHEAYNGWFVKLYLHIGLRLQVLAYAPIVHQVMIWTSTTILTLFHTHIFMICVRNIDYFGWRMVTRPSRKRLTISHTKNSIAYPIVHSTGYSKSWKGSDDTTAQWWKSRQNRFWEKVWGALMKMWLGWKSCQICHYSMRAACRELRILFLVWRRCFSVASQSI